jgi:hypothetical protein
MAGAMSGEAAGTGRRGILRRDGVVVGLAALALAVPLLLLAVRWPGRGATASFGHCIANLDRIRAGMAVTEAVRLMDSALPQLAPHWTGQPAKVIGHRRWELLCSRSVPGGRGALSELPEWLAGFTPRPMRYGDTVGYGVEAWDDRITQTSRRP